jgi:hypothetical protein
MGKIRGAMNLMPSYHDLDCGGVHVRSGRMEAREFRLWEPGIDPTGGEISTFLSVYFFDSNYTSTPWLI